MTDADEFFQQESAPLEDNGNLAEEPCCDEDHIQNPSDSDIDSDREDKMAGSLAEDARSCAEDPITIASFEETSAESIAEDNSTDVFLEQILETLERLEGLFSAKIDRSEYELETLKKQSEEIQEYKSDLYASILTPVLKPLSRMHSYMKRALLKAQADDADSIAIDEFEFAFEDLTEVIEDNGVEIRTYEAGCPFESSCMKITSQVEVSDQEMNKTVSLVSSDAYIFKSGVLEKARTVVNVYSSEQSSSG